MCQPMPRTCNCPHPVQVDVRADRECSCACPSSPECACPPSERKFSRAQVKCQNAKLCYTPRQQPGPKCRCTECQPSLPPPCDPCTSTKCRPLIPTIPSYDRQTKYINKMNHHHDDRHKKSSPSACNRKTKFSNLDRTECCSPLFYQASGQSENYYKNFEEDQQVDEGIKDENFHDKILSKCQRDSDKPIDNYSMNFKKQSNYLDQDFNKNLIKKDCTCGSSGKCNFCFSINIKSESKESCKIEINTKKINHDHDKTNNCNNSEEKNNDNCPKKSRKTSKFLESLKRATNFFPSMKTKIKMVQFIQKKI